MRVLLWCVLHSVHLPLFITLFGFISTETNWTICVARKKSWRRRSWNITVNWTAVRQRSEYIHYVTCVSLKKFRCTWKILIFGLIYVFPVLIFCECYQNVCCVRNKVSNQWVVHYELNVQVVRVQFLTGAVALFITVSRATLDPLLSIQWMLWMGG